MKSMTGFGSASVIDPETGIGFKAELSSVNRKQLEIKLALAREFLACEVPLRTLLAEHLSRGSITLRVEKISGGSAEQNYVDFSGLKAVYQAARQFQQENQIPGAITISDLLAIPDAAVAIAPDYSAPVYLETMKKAVMEAIQHFIAMRSREGETLKADLLSRIDWMEKTVREIQPLAEALPKQQTEKLFQKVKELGLLPESDDERLLKEAVIYGDKLDTTEEITRLFCHFEHFRTLADSPESAGRSLDFLVQEIFRECNTLGTKAASTGISPKIVELKTELEKIREQVQNIE